MMKRLGLAIFLLAASTAMATAQVVNPAGDQPSQPEAKPEDRIRTWESKLALVNSLDERGRRGDFDKQFLIGPSLQIRPLPQMHIDFAPLFGMTKTSARAKVFVVLGWEF